jgi:hypothetical protein
LPPSKKHCIKQQNESASRLWMSYRPVRRGRLSWRSASAKH